MNYTRLDYSQAMEIVVDGYLGGYADYLTIDELDVFPFAPHKTIIDLSDMTVVQVDEFTHLMNMNEVFQVCASL